MMEKIETDKAPAAIGPYSQGVAAGDFVFYSGQIPLEPASGELVSGGIDKQTRQVMANMGEALAAAGLDFSHVVKTTIYLTDLADFTVVNGIYGEFFSGIYPARATVQVAALPKGAAIEIEWVAFRG
ncbi:RidA family protein [Desulfuromonas sp. AOP6]|uniref:RidA family protein n=1 Tax=Desulfuromonas sp. AOP6 TaxID=1566351 RepID=UPI0012766E5D|nr:RidA family protein [Desulfuromonas sp. AOP6]BCA80066.1 reactive intermediate/imine deaminase [Desulfuromonas sp. AOP6]